MIKLNNTPGQLLTVGFIGIKFSYDHPEAKEWLLSLGEKEYYGEYGNIIFVRMDSIETIIRLKFNEAIEDVYRHKNDWRKRNFAVDSHSSYRYKVRRRTNFSKSTITQSKISGKKKKHWVKKKYQDDNRLWRMK